MNSQEIRKSDLTITEEQANELVAFLNSEWQTIDMPVVRSDRCETVDEHGAYPKLDTRRAEA